MLDSLAVVREHAPGFIDTYLLESWMARNLYERTRSPEMLRRARSVTRAAMDLAPDDTRPYQRLFDLEFYAGDLDAAEAATASLETIDPTSVEVLRQRAKIAQRRGDASRARELLQRVVERRPARRYLQDLIELEYAQAWNDDARRHLNEMLERFPGDNYARSKLAQIELLYGSAKRAKVLYEELLEDSRDVVKLTNLGLACELLGEYPSAAAWFREAAASTPDDATAVINLADCEKMSGNTERADSLYEAVLRLIAADSNPDDLYNLQMRAQALAHLGRDREAVAVVQEALGRDPGNAWTLYAAGLVYTLIGDRVSATVSIEKAAEKGVDGRWFQLALFAAVQNEPAVQAIMSSDPIRGETP
jgi:tetratricopeptide (TPR) repeat protein